MTAAPYPDDAHVRVFSFSRQQDGEELVIGRVETGVFLALPAETVAILDDLAAGHTVGETRRLYQERHGENPDLADFLEALESKGFVAPQSEPPPPGDELLAASQVVAPASANAEDATTAGPSVRQFHFANFPQGVAAALFGKTALAVYFAVIAAAVVVGVQDPSLVPGRSALVFDRFHTFKILGVVLFSVVTLFVHEMGHLLAARALGVGARLGISHRLWILVAETDMTGLWSVPRGKRYLPLVAGPLTDLVSASLIVLTLFADRQGWLTLPALLEEMMRAVFFAYFIQVAWQFFFFLRTDFYYVFANAFQCKNLMQDTEDLLKNLVARVRGREPAVDQSHIPPKERRVIKGYSAVWVIGRLAAFALFFTVTIPVTLAYFHKVAGSLRAGLDSDWVAFWDSILLVSFSITAYAAGMFLWLRSLNRRWRVAKWRRA